MSDIYQRKLDHIQWALSSESQFDQRSTGFDSYFFKHQALPEIDLNEIDLSLDFMGKTLAAPFLIASMTGGPDKGAEINLRLAEAAQKMKIGMGLGSQRITVERPETLKSFWVRDIAPDILLISNFGAVQLNYGYGLDTCRQVVEQVGADALYLHLNPLQEAVQTEGDVNFKGLWPKIEALARTLEYPILLKECGNGLSLELAERARQAGVFALEISGAGGTSWAKIEGLRSTDPLRKRLGETFGNWGIPTTESLVSIHEVMPEMPLIASGGVRNGLDLAKAIALGASLGALATPFLKAATLSTEAVCFEIEALMQELKIAMFCVGARNLSELKATPIFKKSLSF